MFIGRFPWFPTTIGSFLLEKAKKSESNEIQEKVTDNVCSIISFFFSFYYLKSFQKSFFKISLESHPYGLFTFKTEKSKPEPLKLNLLWINNNFLSLH